MRLITMTIVAALALLLLNVQSSCCCDQEGRVLICQDIPSYFSPEHSTLVMYLSNVGEINSTVFRSDALASVTRLRMDSAGVTGIAEGAFSSLVGLTSVSLKQNRLKQMNPKWFGWHAALTELHLSGNQIEAVDESSLRGLTDLQTLNLSSNRITTIHPNSFHTQTNLTQLDLSKNRMTRLKAEALRSVTSAEIKLDGNPWDCSCGAEDLVVLMKDLKRRSVLHSPMEVTCDTPPSLRGRPVWNVTVCTTFPTTGSEQVSVHHKPRDPLTTQPASSETAETTSMSKTKMPVQTEPADPHTGTYVTSSPQTGPFITSHPAVTENCLNSKPSSDTNAILSALTAVIVLLCVLLFVVCFLAVQRRRKCNNKAVMPERPSEDTHQEAESRPSQDQSENSDPEEPWRGPYTGIRAKSAHAALSVCPFYASGKNQVTVDNETQSKDVENLSNGKQKLESEGAETENITNASDVITKNQEQTDTSREKGKIPHGVSVSTDTVLYLSIGTNQNKPNPDGLNKDSNNTLGQRSQMGKAMVRISTWPLTAVQWQARCNMTEQNGTEFSDEVTTVNEVEQPPISDKEKKGDEKEEDLITSSYHDPPKTTLAIMKSSHRQTTKLNDKTMSLSEAQAHADIRQKDPAAARQTVRKTRNQDPEPAESPACKTDTKNRRDEPTEVTSRQGAENTHTGPKASGGATPDDETLLSGNDYAFMDLLHEVVQNKGRWTRDRWRQAHSSRVIH